MTPLPELLSGEELQNPIEVRQHTYSLTPRKGVGGKTYAEKMAESELEKSEKVTIN